MANTENLNRADLRRTYIPANLTYKTMSDLGREIYDLVQQIPEEELLSEEEIELEIARRRGGYIPEDAR